MPLEYSMESTAIQANNGITVFVDGWDDAAVWLSIQTQNGSAHCTIERKQAQALIVALQAAIGETA
jgi:hypothetical protein